MSRDCLDCITQAAIAPLGLFLSSSPPLSSPPLQLPSLRFLNGGGLGSWCLILGAARTNLGPPRLTESAEAENSSPCLLSSGRLYAYGQGKGTKFRCWNPT